MGRRRRTDFPERIALKELLVLGPLAVSIHVVHGVKLFSDSCYENQHKQLMRKEQQSHVILGSYVISKL